MNLDIPKVGDLQIAQDLTFQNRSWLAQRIGWVAMIGVVVAALVGVFGEGPLTDGEVRTDDGAVRVLYPEHPRKRAPETIRMLMGADAVDGDELRLAFARRYLNGVTIESIHPEPDSVETGTTETVFVFTLTDEGLPAEVIFNVLYDDIGRKRGHIRLDGHPSVALSQFVYP